MLRLGDRVRSTNDGQLGYLAEVEGRMVVRLDRKAEGRWVPFEEKRWELDTAVRLTPLQIARVVYEADRAYQLITGQAFSLPEWIGLRDEQRLPWCKSLPPGASEDRKRLAQSIRAELTK